MLAQFELVAHPSLRDPITKRRRWLRDLAPPVAGTPPSPSSNPVIPRLPNELLHECVLQLDTLRYDSSTKSWSETDEEPWRDLAALALTSKAFLPVARERLYRKVTIKVETTPGRSWIDTLPDDFDLESIPEEYVFATGPKALESSLIFRPHLASLVLRLEIIFLDTELPVSILDIPAQTLTALLRASRNVTHVQIRVASLPSPQSYLQKPELASIISALSKAPIKLEYLELSGMLLYDAIEGPAVPLPFADLKELTLGPEMGWDSSSFDSPTPSLADEIVYHLSSFTSTHTLPNVDFGRGVLAHSHQSLRKLSLVFSSAMEVLDLTSFKNLNHLTWTSDQDEDVDDPECAKRVIDSIRPLSLHTLAIRHDVPSPHGFSSAQYGTTFDYIPSSLVILELAQVVREPFITFLQSGTACPHLQTVNVWNIKEEEAGRGVGLSYELIGDLVEVGQARGLSLIVDAQDYSISAVDDDADSTAGGRSIGEGEEGYYTESTTSDGSHDI
ncbi:hypothetical protein RQP46_003341 [Phenoliferia psychrophenolica]